MKITKTLHPPLRDRMFGILLYLLPIVCTTVVLDQYSKFIIESAMHPEQVIPVIDGLFNLTLHYNRGAAFGLFHELPDGTRQAVLWSVSSIAVIMVLYFLVMEYYGSVVGKVSLSLILGGAVGNGLDRALRGEVVDFLDFYFGSYHWPAFNVADSAITVGALLLIFLSFVEGRSPKGVS